MRNKIEIQVKFAAFLLSILVLIPYTQCGICGNAVKSNDQECDDGNKISGDGCSSICKLERLYICSSGKISICTKSCVNGVLDTIAKEECDDGDSDNTNGCTNDCRLIPGWNCYTVNAQKTVCSEKCGDGIIVGKQKLTSNCDDSNLLNGDGCSSTCQVEPGYECTIGRIPYCLKIQRCGNGKYEPTNGQFCDDGDLINENGCNTTCQITNSSFKCENTIKQKSICYFDCVIPTKATTINLETIYNHQNLLKPDTCFNNLNNEQVCFKDCSNIYYHQTVIESGVYLNAYFNDKLYCNDHNLISGDGCSNCKIDDGFNSTKLSLLEEKNQSFYLQYARISYIHNCGNQILDENQNFEIPKYPQTRKNCSVYCPFTKSVCGNLIVESEEECDSLVGCKQDCTGPLNENFTCQFQYAKSLTNKFVTVINISICTDTRIKIRVQEMMKHYLRFQKLENLGFYNFSMSQIKQLYVQNSVDFSFFEIKSELYTPPRLLYYLASSLVNGQIIEIKYNINVQNMQQFIQNVLIKTLNQEGSFIKAISFAQSWEVA